MIVSLTTKMSENRLMYTFFKYRKGKSVFYIHINKYRANVRKPFYIISGDKFLNGGWKWIVYDNVSMTAGDTHALVHLFHVIKYTLLWKVLY